jgi:hypothetical protein
VEWWKGRETYAEGFGFDVQGAALAGEGFLGYVVDIVAVVADPEVDGWVPVFFQWLCEGSGGTMLWDVQVPSPIDKVGP